MENKTFSNEKKWKKYLFTLCTLGIYLWIYRQKRIVKERKEKEHAAWEKKWEKWEEEHNTISEKAWAEYKELLKPSPEHDPNDFSYMSDCVSAWNKAVAEIKKWEKENPKP